MGGAVTEEILHGRGRRRVTVTVTALRAGCRRWRRLLPVDPSVRFPFRPHPGERCR
jgi:hypothetical protein